MRTFTRETLLNATVERVWEFHAQPDALERLSPPDGEMRIVRFSPLKEGETVELSVQVRPLPLRISWVARYASVTPPTGFVDVAVKSPFSFWEHHHRFIREGEKTRMRDEVHWKPPLGALGNLFGGPFVEAMLERQFKHRHAVLVAHFGAG